MPASTDAPRVFVTNPMRDVIGSDFDPLSSLASDGGSVSHRIWPGPAQPTAAELAAALAECEGLLCVLTDRVDAELLDCAPRLRVISSCSVGVDHIDLEAARARGIAVGNTPGVLTETTAELAFALMLDASRRVSEADRFLRAGRWSGDLQWQPGLLLGRDLFGATLGIVGLGAIGRAVAARAQAFGMRVLGWSRGSQPVPGVERVDFKALLERSDFVSLHVALSAETRHLIDAPALAQMRRDAILINTARGSIVDEGALHEALVTGEIAGAGLDVFEHEPIAKDSPLLGLDQVVLVPHIGSATVRTRRRMLALAVENLTAGLSGNPLPHPVA